MRSVPALLDLLAWLFGPVALLLLVGVACILPIVFIIQFARGRM